MKIFSIVLVRKDPTGSRIIACEYDLSSFGFFQRSQYLSQCVASPGTLTSFVCPRMQEFMAFFSRTIAERTERGVRQTVEEDSMSA